MPSKKRERAASSPGPHTPVRLGLLVAIVYEQAHSVTSDAREATRLAALALERLLGRSDRSGLWRELAAN